MPSVSGAAVAATAKSSRDREAKARRKAVRECFYSLRLLEPTNAHELELLKADAAYRRIDDRLAHVRLDQAAIDRAYEDAACKAAKSFCIAGVSALVIVALACLLAADPWSGISEDLRDVRVRGTIFVGFLVAVFGIACGCHVRGQLVRCRFLSNELTQYDVEVEKLEAEQAAATELLAQAINKLLRARSEEVRAASEHAQLEKQRAERAAAEAREEARLLADARHASGFLKRAFKHWRIVAPNPEAYADRWWREIIAKRPEIVGDYQDLSSPVMGDQCHDLAVWALEHVPHEVAFCLPKTRDRTAERLTYILRRFAGDYLERVLPRALERQREEREKVQQLAEHDARLARREAAIARRHRIATTYGTRRPLTPLERLEQRVPDPKASDPVSGALAQIAQRLPPEEVAQALTTATAALEGADLEAFNFEIIRRERQRLEREGLDEETVRDRITELELNLNEGTYTRARRKGMVG